MSPSYKVDKTTLTPYQQLQEMERTHVCAECGGRLVIVWSGGLILSAQRFTESYYELRCGKKKEHRGIARWETQSKEIERRIMVESNKLMEMPEKDMLARIELAKFPQQLTAQDKKLLAIACITYGFDPLMGELTIYQGRPYVTIDGRYRKAQETKELDGVSSRPATKQEKIDWEIPEGDYFFRSEVHRKGAAHPFVGWGRVRAIEAKVKDGFRPIETNPQGMAEKRAEAHALRKGFHIPLPSWEERDEPETPGVVGVTPPEKAIAGPTEAKKAPETPGTVIPPQKQPEATPALTEAPAGIDGVIPPMKNYGALGNWILDQGLSPTEFLAWAGKKVWQEYGSIEAAKEAVNRWLKGEKA